MSRSPTATEQEFARQACKALLALMARAIMDKDGAEQNFVYLMSVFEALEAGSKHGRDLISEVTRAAVRQLGSGQLTLAELEAIERKGTIIN